MPLLLCRGDSVKAFPFNNAIFFFIFDEKPRKIVNYLCCTSTEELEVTSLISYFFDVAHKSKRTVGAIASPGYIPNLKPSHFSQALSDLENNRGGDLNPWACRPFKCKTILCSLRAPNLPNKPFSLHEYPDTPNLICCDDLLANYQFYQEEHPDISISIFFDGLLLKPDPR